MINIDLKKFVNEKTFIRKLKPFSFGTYAECEQLFIEAFELTDQTMANFEMLPEYKEVIEWLADSQGKGLFMTGSNGRGKTAILKGVLPLIFISRGRVLKPVNSNEIDFKNLRETLNRTWALVIDEVGKDEIENDYGTKRDSVEIAIDHCEDQMKLLIMTSNLNRSQIIERYGKRTEDRINRLCKMVIFKGESLRK